MDALSQAMSAVLDVFPNAVADEREGEIVILTGSSTSEEVQPKPISDEVRRLVISDWFATEWLMVAENDRESYEQLQENAKESENVVALSDVLREDWERLAEQVTDLVNEQISETAGLFISQIDLKDKKMSGFDFTCRYLKDVPGFSVVTLKTNHRHPIVEPILQIYSNYRD